jgi:hypothetical protein
MIDKWGKTYVEYPCCTIDNTTEEKKIEDSLFGLSRFSLIFNDKFITGLMSSRENVIKSGFFFSISTFFFCFYFI